jgi:nucleotide-binding universal stress UspA family protein
VFSHIAVGSDGRPGADDAVALGAAIASATGARLSFVGVFPPTFLPVEGVTDRKALRAEVTRTLREQRDRLAPDAIIHTIANASPSRALRQFARRNHADLVVVGSGHAAAPGHVAIGRNGRQLLYDAPFSLAVAASGLHERSPDIHKVGVGYDGGPEADAALAVAAGLATGAQAKLLVRRVAEDLVPVLTGEQWIALADWSHEHMWERERQKALVEAQTAASRLGISAELSATVGDPGYEMRAFSEAVDLILVGSRRWGPVARLVTGGVGETLVTDANCSVLIVPRPVPARRERSGNRGARRPTPA